MSDDMRITSISIHNFKSLYDVSFEPGNVNVLIGANGSPLVALVYIFQT